ncbi:hypothetical protein PP175_11085 [Aneurinibacillus sp. Ricciae_BoGa-3]|nr:hypothetical protein [Aneurinibacillus sp. Ricciae_BoGa-3]WCK56407.1 hypothetical protein PP175_11085 [Aneurinibacillus sp. Ricciae_BoGa-3]
MIAAVIKTTDQKNIVGHTALSFPLLEDLRPLCGTTDGPALGKLG